LIAHSFISSYAPDVLGDKTLRFRFLMALRISPFIHGGSAFRTVIILLGIDSPAACNITFEKSVPADDTLPPRCLDCIVLRQHEVQDVLRLLNTNKASGPDTIHAKLLKVAYDIISKPLCAIGL
jgi:hypothetical protein